MRRIHKLLTMMSGGGAALAIPLLRDYFGTDEAAPLATPRTCDVGTLTIAAQNLAAISGGVLNIPANGSIIAQFVRNLVAGDVWIGTYAWSGFGGIVRHGFGTTGASAAAVCFTLNNGWQLQFYENGAAVQRVVGSVSSPLTLCVVRAATKIFAFTVSGTTGTLAWVGETLANNMNCIVDSNPTNARTVDNLKATNYTPWAVDSAFEVASKAITVDSDTLTGQADGLFRHTIVAQAGVTQSFWFRRTDVDNCWRLDCDQAGGTIKLYKRTGGVDTEVDAGKTQTWVAGNSYRLSVFASGNTIQTYVANTAKHSTTDATHNTATGLAVSHAGTNLIAYKSTIAIPSEL